MWIFPWDIKGVWVEEVVGFRFKLAFGKDWGVPGYTTCVGGYVQNREEISYAPESVRLVLMVVQSQKSGFILWMTFNTNCVPGRAEKKPRPFHLDFTQHYYQEPVPLHLRSTLESAGWKQVFLGVMHYLSAIA